MPSRTLQASNGLQDSSMAVEDQEAQMIGVAAAEPADRPKAVRRS
jgi:hypothetical protein